MGNDAPAEISYGRRLTQLADERPDESDLVIVGRDGSEQSLPFALLETRANQLARTLQEHGVGPDDVVALALPTCPEHILVTLAIWKLGATLLPLRFDQPQWEIDRLLALAEPRVLVSDEHTALCPVLDRRDIASSEANSAAPLPDRISEIANLGASSGSTGTPKLIVTPSRGVVADDPSHAELMGGSRRAILVTSPLYHVNGFSFAAPAVLEGDKAIVMEKFDAAQAVELIERHHVTFSVMVPTMLQRIARLPRLRPEQLASLERVVYGGAKIPEWVVDRWIELIEPDRFVFAYGSTERLGLVTMTGEDWRDHRGATGRPIDAEVSIRDENGDPVPTGRVGTIYMKPLDPNRRVFEYMGVPTPTPTDDGFHTIGDLGSVDEEGFLYVADRRNDLIISGGANVFPAEVEAALSEHPAVVDQVVVPVPDDEWGHRVHAIVQLDDTAPEPTAEDLRAWCKERLAAYKAPKTVEIVDRLPRTDAGKLNRTRLGEERGAAMNDWQEKTVEIDGVVIRYRTRGAGPTIVFVHGVYVCGALWDDVADHLQGFHCIVPTWPLGAHADPAADADVSARANVRRILSFVEALGLEDVTLVGNDTGGGLCLAALGCGHPGLDRLRRLVLTNCDSFEHFPPKGFDRIAAMARHVPPVGAAFIRFLASGRGRKFFLDAVCAQPLTQTRAGEIFGAFATSKSTRRDALRFTQSLEPSVTLDAVDALRSFDHPVLLAWGDRDRLFPIDHAQRLEREFPHAELTTIGDAATYVMLDQPVALAEAIAGFVGPPG